MAETVAKRIPQEYEIELGSNLFSQSLQNPIRLTQFKVLWPIPFLMN